MSSWADLPEDVVVKILCRLPVKSVIRSTCVSKQWLSIISEPEFRRCHFKLASQLRTLRRKILLTSYPSVREPGPRPNACYNPTSRLPPRFQSLEDKFSVKNFTFPSQENEDMKEMGSCNGLILLGDRSGYMNLSIWNLTTGFFRKIPNPSFRLKSIQLPNKEFLFFISHGFGYVSETDDYKLVLIKPAIGDLLVVHIFSLRANIWRVITAPYSSWPGWNSGQGTFSNGAIHWVIDRRNKGSDPVIYAFDLAKEELRKVPLPPVLWQNEDSRNPTVINTLVHLGGYLSISSRKRYDHKVDEVWAMTVYGVPESWVRLCQLDADDLRIFNEYYTTWDLCFVTESNTMVIRLGKELFWIECGNKKKPLCSERYKLEEVHPEVSGCSFYFNATAYDETLVAIAE